MEVPMCWVVLHIARDIKANASLSSKSAWMHGRMETSFPKMFLATYSPEYTLRQQLLQGFFFSRDGPSQDVGRKAEKDVWFVPQANFLMHPKSRLWLFDHFHKIHNCLFHVPFAADRVCPLDQVCVKPFVPKVDRLTVHDENV
jgi:hypothetical protein